MEYENYKKAFLDGRSSTEDVKYPNHDFGDEFVKSFFNKHLFSLPKKETVKIDKADFDLVLIEIKQAANSINSGLVTQKDNERCLNSLQKIARLLSNK